jgi:glycerol-3-phosphate dehydrogenase (NAD(P)+)
VRVDTPQPNQTRLDQCHERTRTQGVNVVFYWTVRAVLEPFFALYFRLRRYGRNLIPSKGPLILACNHRSFLDPFVIGTCVHRPVYFVAKQELFERRVWGRVLNALGAFPVRRGQSDQQAMDTARALLDRGEVVVIFMEGTRVRSTGLGRPKRGVGHLALSTGSPVVPVAVAGSEHIRRGVFVRPRRVAVRCGRPLSFSKLGAVSPQLAGEVTRRIWPRVQLQWEWLGGLPPIRSACVVGAGPMGTALAVLLARAGVDVELACRTRSQARNLTETRISDHLEGIALPDNVRAVCTSDAEVSGVDLVVFAVPARRVGEAASTVGAKLEDHTAVLVASKGLVGPSAETASSYLKRHIRSRALAVLGGPSHAQEAVSHGTSIVLSSRSSDFNKQLSELLTSGGLHVELTDDVVGVELAGCAKNAATLAASAALECGNNAAGAAAGAVFSEIHALAIKRGAQSKTFIGLAGCGDLVATVLADQSRNRRAGELLAQGLATEQIANVLGGTAESLDSVPLLAEALSQHAVEAPAIQSLNALIQGRIDLERWNEGVSSIPVYAPAA